jgi:hypothetical protein
MCYEVFNKSAADRYIHEQKRARREQEGISPDPVTPSPTTSSSEVPSSTSFTIPPVGRAIGEQLDKVDWEAAMIWISTKPIHFVKSYKKELGLGAAIIVLGVLALTYATPTQRMKMFGAQMRYSVAPKTSLGYLITLRTNSKSWSEREGRLDTPLGNSQKDEMGTVKLSGGPAQKKGFKVWLKTQEWIVNQSGSLIQNVPTTHPSFKVSQILLDNQGKIVSRETNYSPRAGRILPFLMPRWPVKTPRIGKEWAEPVEWVEAVGDWKIFWKGRLVWSVLGFETNDGRQCVRLKYEAQVKPTLWESPAWAKDAVRGVSYRGTASGEAFFDVKNRYLYTNSFEQDGTLTIPINNIYRIPADLRVGRTPRRGWGQDGIAAQPGTIVIQIKNTLGIRKS